MSICNVFLRLRALSKLRYKAVKCGHRTQRSGSVSAFGRTITTEMPEDDKGLVDYCLDCIANMAMQCAWCGDPIFIGDPITLYAPCGDFQVPEHAVIHNNEPLQLVGCLGWSCAETGADRAGFWLPGENGKGRVHRVPIAYEAILSAWEPSMMIVDLSDMKEAVNPTLISLKS